MKFELTTAVEDPIIRQELYSIDLAGHRERISEWLCNTREATIRDALVKLGWTPPREFVSHEQIAREANEPRMWKGGDRMCPAYALQNTCIRNCGVGPCKLRP